MLFMLFNMLNAEYSNRILEFAHENLIQFDVGAYPYFRVHLEDIAVDVETDLIEGAFK
jgi:hypothetical protein